MKESPADSMPPIDHITDHSAAKRDQGGGATTAILQQGVENALPKYPDF